MQTSQRGGNALLFVVGRNENHDESIFREWDKRGFITLVVVEMREIFAVPLGEAKGMVTFMRGTTHCVPLITVLE
jgi:hypothetical protein